MLCPALGTAGHPVLRGRGGSPPAGPRPGIDYQFAPQSLPLISASRWLLKRGELCVVEETGLFRKLASRPTCYLFLFNDVLLITRKKRWAPPLGTRQCGSAVCRGRQLQPRGQEAGGRGGS